VRIARGEQLPMPDLPALSRHHMLIPCAIPTQLCTEQLEVAPSDAFAGVSTAALTRLLCAMEMELQAMQLQ